MIGTTLRRFLRDDSGMEATEVALGVALAAIGMGLGGFTFFDGIADYFVTNSENIDNYNPGLPNNGSYSCDAATGNCGVPAG